MSQFLAPRAINSRNEKTTHWNQQPPHTPQPPSTGASCYLTLMSGERQPEMRRGIAFEGSFSDSRVVAVACGVAYQWQRWQKKKKPAGEGGVRVTAANDETGGQGVGRWRWWRLWFGEGWNIKKNPPQILCLQPWKWSVQGGVIEFKVHRYVGVWNILLLFFLRIVAHCSFLRFFSPFSPNISQLSAPEGRTQSVSSAFYAIIGEKGNTNTYTAGATVNMIGQGQM